MTQTTQNPPATQGAQQPNRVALTVAAINGVAKISELFELPGMADAWIRAYQNTSGKTDGEQRWEAEKILIAQLVSSTPALQTVEPFSMYTAMSQLSISGLSLREGMAYILPKGKKAVFMPGWKGRLEQINDMPDVIHCHEPQVVYTSDIFEMEKGEKVKIIKHIPGGKHTRTKADTITDVYFVIDFNYGTIVYHMHALDVLNIRDHRSDSFKAYKKLCEDNGKQLGDTWKQSFTGRNGAYEKEVELPMWISDEAQAFKKTIVKRTYGALPKQGKAKILDDKIKEAGAETIDPDDNFDAKKYEDLVLADEKPEDTKQEALPESAGALRTDISEAELIIEDPADAKQQLAAAASNPNEGF